MLQLIREFKERPTTSEEDASNLAWTMELIAREQLYTVHFGEKSGASSHMTTEMTDWMRSNLQVSIGGAHPDRRTRESTIKPSGRETAGRETDTEGSSAHGGKRNTVLSKVRGLTIGGAGTGGVHDHAAGMHSALAEGSAKEVVEELPWLSTLLNDTRVARMLELSEDWKVRARFHDHLLLHHHHHHHCRLHATCSSPTRRLTCSSCARRRGTGRSSSAGCTSSSATASSTSSA